MSKGAVEMIDIPKPSTDCHFAKGLTVGIYQFIYTLKMGWEFTYGLCFGIKFVTMGQASEAGRRSNEIEFDKYSSFLNASTPEPISMGLMLKSPLYCNKR